jgi:hypothetical protein
LLLGGRSGELLNVFLARRVGERTARAVAAQGNILLALTQAKLLVCAACPGSKFDSDSMLCAASKEVGSLGWGRWLDDEE